jgi:hypothetical protein
VKKHRGSAVTRNSFEISRQLPRDLLIQNVAHGKRGGDAVFDYENSPDAV